MTKQKQPLLPKEFIRKHNPKKTCCPPCIKPILLLRFALRSLIPIALGIASGALTEWGERSLGVKKLSTLVGLSDISSCAITLLVAYVINALFDCCWPANPNKSNRFFQMDPAEVSDEGETYAAIPM